jgi:hypothetical protein
MISGEDAGWGGVRKRGSAGASPENREQGEKERR